jgi:hypothetical protein
MICLTCGHNQQNDAPECQKCEAYLGKSQVGQGYLPQLSILQEQLQAQKVTAEQAEDRLLRLDDTLGFLIKQMVQMKEQLQQHLRDLPEGTVAGVINPVVEAMTNFRSLAADLTLDGNWTDNDWTELKKAQATWQSASQGLVALSGALGKRVAQGTSPSAN